MDATQEGRGHERRCHAHARSGQRCRRLAIPGGTVCVMHGGAAPQVAGAARRRLSSAAVAEILPGLVGPEVLARVVNHYAAHPADTTHALARLSRARKRQPRWWVAADAQQDRDYAKALRAAIADALARMASNPH